MTAYSFWILRHLALAGGGVYGISHPLDCNVYAIVSNGEAAIFDAGCGIDTDRLIANLRSLGIERLKYIFLTHCHADHVCGAPAIREALGGQIVASEQDSRLISTGSDYDLGLEQARLSGSYPNWFNYVHFAPDVEIRGTATFSVGELEISALVLPSHTPGSTLFTVQSSERRDMVSGDVVMVGGLVSLINVPGCELADYRTNLPTVTGLGVDGLFPGHWMWCVNDGQKHIDEVIAQLKRSRLPRNFASLLG
jgi:glyoxylase-like metal-dependent hydrolase (beta-lactamase superfamily II)